MKGCVCITLKCGLCGEESKVLLEECSAAKDKSDILEQQACAHRLEGIQGPK
jgi:hypothetical protein